MIPQKPKVDPMCAAMSTASEKPKEEVPWNWRTEVLERLNVNLVKSIQEQVDTESMDAINRGMIDAAVVAGDYAAVVLCRMVHKSVQFRDQGEMIVVLASNVAEAMQVASQHQKSQWPLERVDFLSPHQQVEWLPAVISEPVLRYYATKLGLTVSRDAAVSDGVPAVACGLPIPLGYYYSKESNTFHHKHNNCQADMGFWQQWQHRREEFPSKWHVYNGTRLIGWSAAKTEAEAVANVARLQKLFTVGLHAKQA